MTSLASREMTEQEMINTCTAPQMAHLIQVLRQTIRNKDKEIEKWVDMVSQLQRDGKWVQVVGIPPETLYWEAGNQLYYLLLDREDEKDIIHSEPLAPEGSAEWAWQMLKLGKPVTNKWVFMDGGYIKDTDSDKYRFVQMWDFFSDWQLYEEKPEPEYKVGDWSAITRKLDPSEVKVTLTLEGTVSRDYNETLDSFILNHTDGHTRNCIKYSTIDPDTAAMVRELLAAQEENNG